MKKNKPQPLKIDPRLREFIFRAVRQPGSSPWPVDDHYSGHGTFQERFERGDWQIMLWAIVLAAKSGEQIPQWATDALEDAILRVAVADKDWEGVFGPTNAKRVEGGKGANPDKIAHRAKYMLPFWDTVNDLHSYGRGVANVLYEQVGEMFGFSGSVVREYCTDMRRRGRL